MVDVKGGDQLEKALNKIAAAADRAASVDVGFMGDATEPDGTSVALVAALNNFGTAEAPPRPFFNNAIDKNKEKWPGNLATALRRNGWNAHTALGLMGLEIRDEINGEIVALRSPPLAPSTVARKGFDKPLIDTSTMLKSTTFKLNTR